jgi:hypothetical protein
MLSNRGRRDSAPNLSNDFGRGLLRELDPATSLRNRPRGTNDGELAFSDAETDGAQPARSSGSTCGDWD